MEMCTYTHCQSATFDGQLRSCLRFGDRLKVLLLTDRQRRPPATYLKHVEMKKIVWFTLIQLVALVLIFAVTKTPAAILFPVFIAIWKYASLVGPRVHGLLVERISCLQMFC